MSVEYTAQFTGRSGVSRTSAGAATVGLSTNSLREPTFLEGELRDPLRLRESLSALHAVVVSDFRFKPRTLADRAEFAAWLAEQDRQFLAGLGGAGKATRIAELEAKLAELDLRRNARRREFIAAKARYFNEVAWRSSYEMWYLLDPVVTVHPDEISFEAFSRDESTYARLGVGLDLFSAVGDVQCGTTNIDFSLALHDELQRLRTYRATRFGVQPGGFAVDTVGAGKTRSHLEKKIPLPESWVNGFLQVHATMSLSLTRLSVAPVDLFNLLRTLRELGRARKSPRALRWELTPGEAVRAVIEPWERVLTFSSDRPFEGPTAVTIRTWGRDRLRTIERLLPITRDVTLHLAGTGMPSLYVLDLGDGVTFTLGLSGWTDNDWTSSMAGSDKFALLTRPSDCDADQLLAAYKALRDHRRLDESALAAAAMLSRADARAAVSALCAAGRATADLSASVAGSTMVYRHRDLFAGPFDRAAAERATRGGATPGVKLGGNRQLVAEQIVASDAVRIIARRPLQQGGVLTWKLSGNARGPDGTPRRPLVHVDPGGRVIDASCTCNYYRQHRLTQGPCEHVLALRQLHLSRSREA